MNGKNDIMDTIVEPTTLISGNMKRNKLKNVSVNERIVKGKQSTNNVNAIGKIMWESRQEGVVDASSEGMT